MPAGLAVDHNNQTAHLLVRKVHLVPLVQRHADDIHLLEGPGPGPSFLPLERDTVAGDEEEGLHPLGDRPAFRTGRRTVPLGSLALLVVLLVPLPRTLGQEALGRALPWQEMFLWSRSP